jgi:predicted Zn-dependent protease
VDDSSVNAFAVPGGRMVIYRGLLARTGRAEELAGVLAHEMQHVLLRHGTRAALREIPIRVFVSMVAGDLVGAREAARALGTLGVLRYGRRDELEADREGLRLLQAAAVDPGGMVAFFDTLAAAGPDLPRGFAYMSTHPPTAARRAGLAALATATPAAWTPLDVGDWTALRDRCRAS